MIEHKRNYKRPLIEGVTVFFMSLLFVQGTVADTRGEVAELKQTIEQLKKQLEVMESRLEEIDNAVVENTEAVEATAEAVEENVVSSVLDKISIGGYGELHYNNLDSKRQIDFHRFVLFFNYDYSDRIKFFSELELEHSLAGEDKPGEVELEQAYVEYSFDEANRAKVGLFLLPIGILNETHEPPTFYGVERNTIENIIIPSTWWAGGFGYTYRTDQGLSLDLALHEGLEIDPSSSGVFTPRIRSGRQKTANADGRHLAGTARLKYTGVLGLELAGSLQYQSDITQVSGDALENGFLYEFHAIYNRDRFGLRALYAGWELDTNATIAATGNDSQDGWYIEPSFKLRDNLGIFARYEDVDGGRTSDEFFQWVIGLNYWLNEDIVLKFDYLDKNFDDNRDNDDGFNLGLGYQF